MSNEYPVCEHCGTRHKQCFPSNVEEAGLDYIPTNRRVQLLTIDQRLDGLNDIIAANRKHWSAGNKLKEANELIVQWAIKTSHVKPINGPFKMEIFFSEPNEKRDPDNILSAKKFLLDALQQMQIIPNDGQKQVKGFSESWGLATNEFPVGVHIKLIEE